MRVRGCSTHVHGCADRDGPNSSSRPVVAESGFPETGTRHAIDSAPAPAAHRPDPRGRERRRGRLQGREGLDGPDPHLRQPAVHAGRDGVVPGRRPRGRCAARLGTHERTRREQLVFDRDGHVPGRRADARAATVRRPAPRPRRDRLRSRRCRAHAEGARRSSAMSRHLSAIRSARSGIRGDSASRAPAASPPRSPRGSVHRCCRPMRRSTRATRAAR